VHRHHQASVETAPVQVKDLLTSSSSEFTFALDTVTEEHIVHRGGRSLLEGDARYLAADVPHRPLHCLPAGGGEGLVEPGGDILEPGASMEILKGVDTCTRSLGCYYGTSRR